MEIDDDAWETLQRSAEREAARLPSEALGDWIDGVGRARPRPGRSMGIRLAVIVGLLGAALFVIGAFVIRANREAHVVSTGSVTVAAADERADRPLSRASPGWYPRPLLERAPASVSRRYELAKALEAWGNPMGAVRQLDYLRTLDTPEARLLLQQAARDPGLARWVADGWWSARPGDGGVSSPEYKAP